MIKDKMNPTKTVPPQSPTIQWTRNQQAAIADRGRDLVVSASAGSGKTAVLTERVLQLVTEPDPATGQPPVKLEAMLIITFTEKAARQMRERIEKRIRQELAAEPQSHFLQRAYDALSSAWIMTIDAFCRRLVIEHFHQAGVSPSPRIPDGAEQTELELGVLNSLLEECARQPGPDREALSELLQCTAQGTEELIGELRKLMGFLQSLDRPKLWLSRVEDDLSRTIEASRYEDLPEARLAGEGFSRATGELAEALRELIRLAQTRHGDPVILQTWTGLANRLAQMAQMQGPYRPDAIRAWLDAEAGAILGKMELKKNCGAAIYQDKEFTTQFLKRFSRHFDRWRECWFPLDEAGLLNGAQLAASQGQALLKLAGQALDRIDLIKQRRGLMTFNDFERMALKILSSPTDAMAPSEVAIQLQGQFEHVLVDEYQDTSPLQDAIVRLVARAASPSTDQAGKAGNLFLVGDYKQSIYRFRHAEPTLFLEKLRTGNRINLAENFRSRSRVLKFLNICFEGLMDPAVGEMAYGEGERLVAGRVDPHGADPVCVEVQWMAKAGDSAAQYETALSEENGDSQDQTEEQETLEGLEAQAHWVARRIRELTDPETGLMIPTDEASPTDPNPPLRRAMPGDCAILLRSIRSELDLWMEALEHEGLKVRAPGLNPLFTTSEMIDLLSALRIADNPLQDLPLATLMRSPMARFTDDEMLMIRMERAHGPFHEALWAAAGRPLPAPPLESTSAEPVQKSVMTEELRLKLVQFVERLDRWREAARRQPASEILSMILQDTGYEAYLMGHLDGMARLEHLDFLRGLLRRLSRCDEGANPLASFLEMIDRAESEESDLGELPEAITQPLDAVNLLTVHRSKGLEFPVVFLPRLERRFRERKLGETVCDREAGMARLGVDTARRRRYATLAYKTLVSRLHRKDRSEEIRLLYVAMTRARERLILVGQMAKPEGLAEKWGVVRALGGRPVGALDRLYAACPADLLGPIIEWLRAGGESGLGQPPEWLIVNFDSSTLFRGSTEIWTRVRQSLKEMGLSDLTTVPPEHNWETVMAEIRAASRPEVGQTIETPSRHTLRFVPPYDPAEALTILPTKTTVTELRRNRALCRPSSSPSSGEPEPWVSVDELLREEERFVEEEMKTPYFTRQGTLGSRKPRWVMEEGTAGEPVQDGALPPESEGLLQLDFFSGPQPTPPPRHPVDEPGRMLASRRGTLTHALLAHVDLSGSLDAPGLRAQAASLCERGLLGSPLESSGLILEALDFESIAWFFGTDLGRRMAAHPGQVSRELSFTARKSIRDFAPTAASTFPTESIIMQGVIDAIFDEGASALVIDYKTDRVRGRRHLEEITQAYRVQIEQYARALHSIWRLKTVQSALVFLHPRQIVWVEDSEA